MAAPFVREVTLARRIADHLLFPLNMWLSDDASQRLGLTPIDHERVRAVLPHCRGRLLDLGCGNNLLSRNYGCGFGVDIHPYAGIDARCDSAYLPFQDETFDSVALLACLNHIVRRAETLIECRRVLKPHGRLLVTMIHPLVGFFSHPIRRPHDPDQLERGMAGEEANGLTTRQVLRLFSDAGFRPVLHQRFLWGLNNLHIAEKKSAVGGRQ